MPVYRTFLPLIVAACSAPEVAPLPEDDGADAHAPSTQDVGEPATTDRQADPDRGERGQAATPVVAPPTGPPGEVLPTPAAQLPGVPFSGWTTRADLSLEGTGLTLDRVAVRVEVTAREGDRLRVRCAGCEGAQRDVEGWLTVGSVRAARTPGSTTDPLTSALKRRAIWAGSKNLPAAASNSGMCLLVDRGFQRVGDRAEWSTEGGKLVLEWDGYGWQMLEVRAPERDLGWSCRT